MFIIIVTLALVIGGMYLEKKYSPRLGIKDNQFGLTYTDEKKVPTFKKIF